MLKAFVDDISLVWVVSKYKWNYVNMKSVNSQMNISGLILKLYVF